MFRHLILYSLFALLGYFAGPTLVERLDPKVVCLTEEDQQQIAAYIEHLQEMAGPPERGL